ncbi:MAG: Mur ligase family protein, partial [Pontibacterium sp.]
QQVVYKPNGMTLVLNLRGKEIEINTGLLGAFNVQNLLLVAGVLHAFGISHLDIAQSIEALITVPGRMQVVTTPISHGQPLPHVVVDYAHTPDALEKAIAACRQHATKDSRIICVFGCGGDRDQGKRMQMADIASQTADYCIITSDNPRYEDPMSIINMIENGMVSRDYGVEVDRADAIKKAIISASENDIVLIAGKGHENYQELNGTRYPFSDEVCARASLSEVVS